MISQNGVIHGAKVHVGGPQGGSASIHVFGIGVITGEGIAGKGAAASAGGRIGSGLDNRGRIPGRNIGRDRHAHFPTSRGGVVGGPADQPAAVLGRVFEVHIGQVLETYQIVKPQTRVGAQVGKGRIRPSRCSGQVGQANVITDNGAAGLTGDGSGIRTANALG